MRIMFFPYRTKRAFLSIAARSAQPGNIML